MCIAPQEPPPQSSMCGKNEQKYGEEATGIPELFIVMNESCLIDKYPGLGINKMKHEKILPGAATN